MLPASQTSSLLLEVTLGRKDPLREEAPEHLRFGGVAWNIYKGRLLFSKLQNIRLDYFLSFPHSFKMVDIPSVPTGNETVVHGITMGSAAPHIANEKGKNGDDEYLEKVPTNQSGGLKEAQKQNAIEALGIEN